LGADLNLVEWGRENLDELRDLWNVARPDEPLASHELERTIFADSGVVLATSEGDGVVAVVTRPGEPSLRGFVRLIVVHPKAQRRGIGRALLVAAERWLAVRGAGSVQLGADVPRYLWPGIDATNLPAQALALSGGYRSTGSAINMRMSTDFRVAPQDGIRVDRLRTGDRGVQPAVAAARRLVADHWPAWLVELDLAADAGTLFAAFARDIDDAPGSAIAFMAHSTLRDGWLGPMGTDPRFRRRGAGAAVLSAACADLTDRGFAQADVAWVGAVSYFADLGAVTARCFRQFSRELEHR